MSKRPADRLLTIHENVTDNLISTVDYMVLIHADGPDSASCSAVGAEGRKPQRIILFRSWSILDFSRDRVKPHHSGEENIKDMTVVICATTWMAGGGRPSERRARSAYMENELVA